MGNSLSPSCFKASTSSMVKLIFYQGKTRIITGKTVAGEIMFEFPDHMVCHAGSFFIGHRIPILAIDDELASGETYFVLPLDCLPINVLTASSLASLRRSISSSKPAAVNFKDCPFEYVKGSNGSVLIKVLPEFIVMLITSHEETPQNSSSSPNHDFLCSTPELKKHYDQLVGSKDQVWSPKLETISEYKIRYSPCRFIGLERRLGEAD